MESDHKITSFSRNDMCVCVCVCVCVFVCVWGLNLRPVQSSSFKGQKVKDLRVNQHPSFFHLTHSHFHLPHDCGSIQEIDWTIWAQWVTLCFCFQSDFYFWHICIQPLLNQRSGICPAQTEKKELISVSWYESCSRAAGSRYWLMSSLWASTECCSYISSHCGQLNGGRTGNHWEGIQWKDRKLGPVRRPLPVKAPHIIMDSQLLYQNTLCCKYDDLLWFVAAKLTFCTNAECQQ